MPRTFTLLQRYPAGVQRVYAAFADKRYWLTRLADSGADSAALDSMAVGADGGLDVATTQRIARAKLPALAAQFHPGDLQVRRHEKWHPIRDGRASAEVTGEIVDAPAKLSGDAVLQPVDDGCELQLTATVRVDIPLVGGKIENFIGARLAELMTAEQRFTSTWLAGGRPAPTA